METVKVTGYKCKHFEADIDDLSKCYWCRNQDIPTEECWCDNVLEALVCPGFKKSDEKTEPIEYGTDQINAIQKDFVERLKKEYIAQSVSTLRSIDYFKKKLECIKDGIKRLEEWKPAYDTK